MTVVDDLPWTGWALHKAAAVELAEFLHCRKPRTVVEAGSGLSTVVLADYAATTGAHVVSLEHDEVHAKQTRSLLAERGLDAHADVRLAPLAELDTPAGALPWYGTALPDGIDFALIDGPPGVIGRHAALFALRPHFADGWEAWLDDVNRSPEQDCLALWREHLAVQHHTMTCRHGAVARIRAHPAGPARVDASDVAVTILTGRRPDMLSSTVAALREDAPGLLESAHVTVFHNGGDAATARLVDGYEWMDRKIAHDGPMLPIGEATSRLFSGLPDRPYHLHLQDDWTCATLADDWLDTARAVLADPSVGQVRLRHHSEEVSPRHMVTGQPIRWSRQGGALVGGAHFTLNPALTRTGDASLVFPAADERHAMRRFHDTGMHAAQLVPGVFHHAGRDRSLLGHKWQ